MTEKDAARVIWETSRADEGTISATGANHVARALAQAGLLVQDVAQVPVERDLLRYRQAAGENESAEAWDRDDWLADMDEWLGNTAESDPVAALRAELGRTHAALTEFNALLNAERSALAALRSGT